MVNLEITAGETPKLDCPAGQKPKLIVGDKIPTGDKPIVKVLSVGDNFVVLGPLRSGDLMVNLPCDSSVVEAKITVKPLDAKAAQQHFSALAPAPIPYPVSLFVLIALVLSAIAIGGYFVFRRKKQISFAKNPVRPVRDPRLELEKTLVYLEQNVTHPEAHHFHDLYKNLRRFIERELNLKTRSLTTGEFLGTFRALALQQSANQNIIQQLEYILKTGDDVRFAGKSIDDTSWKDYLGKCRAVFGAFPKETKQPSTQAVKR